ncbi:MAG: thymidine kinase [Bradymonadia bacterium]
MHHLPHLPGWIEVVCGSMFSGKTEELIRRLRRAVYAHQKVQVFKPRVDTRYDDTAVVSHNDARVEAEPVDHANAIPGLVRPDTSVVGVDEAQFFDESLVAVVNQLADKGLRVICAGLDMDYLGQPFEPMPQLMAIAEYVTKTRAICTVCGQPASRSQRLTASESQVELGAHDSYEARCRHHHHDGAGMPEQQPLPMSLPDLGPRHGPVPEQIPLRLKNGGR